MPAKSDATGAAERAVLDAASRYYTSRVAAAGAVVRTYAEDFGPAAILGSIQASNQLQASFDALDEAKTRLRATCSDCRHPGPGPVAGGCERHAILLEL